MFGRGGDRFQGRGNWTWGTTLTPQGRTTVRYPKWCSETGRDYNNVTLREKGVRGVCFEGRDERSPTMLAGLPSDGFERFLRITYIDKHHQ